MKKVLYANLPCDVIWARDLPDKKELASLVDSYRDYRDVTSLTRNGACERRSGPPRSHRSRVSHPSEQESGGLVVTLATRLV